MWNLYNRYINWEQYWFEIPKEKKVNKKGVRIN
jgi:hypothetical protein